jgi:hypothetical protein
MKYLTFFGLAILGMLIFYKQTPVRETVPSVVLQNVIGSFRIKTDGVYSLIDTSKENIGIERYKKYVLVDPILFSKNGYFIQSPHCDWPSYDIIDEVIIDRQRFDYGRYYLSGNQVLLEGKFTFFARGMDWRHYQARYIGYLDSSRDTLFLKIGEPLPKINLRFNKDLAIQLKEGGYQKYVFKSFPRQDVDIDETYFENMIRDKSLKQ